MDLDALRLDTTYKSALAVDAVIDGDVTVRVIDKTVGFDAPFFGSRRIGGLEAVGGILTVKPAVTVRRTELTAKNLTPEDLDGGQIAFNGSTWRIRGYQSIPGVGGEATGEVALLLIDEVAAST